MSRWRDSQLQVRETYSVLTKWTSTMSKSCWLKSRFSTFSTCSKTGVWCANKKEKRDYNRDLMTIKKWQLKRVKITINVSSTLRVKGLTFKVLKQVCINRGDQRGFSTWNQHKCLSYVFSFHLNTHVFWSGYEYVAFRIFWIFSLRWLTLCVRIWRLPTSDSHT